MLTVTVSCSLPPGGSGISGWLVGRSIFAPDGKLGHFYGAVKFLQKRNHPLCSPPGHDECELLPSIAEHLAEGYPFEAGCDEPQDLVAYLMSISIVEMLEVIHVHHGDGIVPSQPEDAFVKSSTARQTHQLIQVGLSPG